MNIISHIQVVDTLCTTMGLTILKTKMEAKRGISERLGAMTHKRQLRLKGMHVV